MRMRDGRVYRGSSSTSDRTRLRISISLVKRECNVFEVMIILRIAEPRASHHLSVLKTAGFLKSRQKGSRVFYALDDVAGGKVIFGVAEMMEAMASRDASLRIDRERLEMMEAGRIRGVNKGLQAFGEEVSSDREVRNLPPFPTLL